MKIDPARFWSRVQRGRPDQCWPWRGAVSRGGYGLVRSSVSATAHKVAWVLTYGPIPSGLFLCHRCDVRRCCNPKHLLLGTNAENMRDRWLKGRHIGGWHPSAYRRNPYSLLARRSKAYVAALMAGSSFAKAERVWGTDSE
jgi:hypothetical protein